MANEVVVFVEVSSGSRNKYELDEELRAVVLDPRWLTGNCSPRGWWLRRIAGWRRPSSPVFPIRASNGRRPRLGRSHPRIDGNCRSTI
jgi:hypothetical protein